MTEDNPYSVSPECIGGMNAQEGLPVGGFQIDGDRIVCGNSVALPPICVFTGAKDDLIQLTSVAQYGSWRLVVRQHSVRCLYYVSQTLHSQHQMFRRVGSGSIALGFATMLGGPFLASESSLGGFLFLLGLLIAVVGFVVSYFGDLRLWIVRHRGNQYWIGGLRPKFFAELQRLVEGAQPASDGLAQKLEGKGE
ncbi:MAG: hypothetical protein JNM43_04135 [Planctomycetaceae bacterium]|nr:hypothetical protein [Planctomycetaceae bacterium]